MIIVDCIIYNKDGTFRTYSPSNDVLIARNDTLNAYNELIKSGRMEQIASYVRKQEYAGSTPENDTVSYSFVFDPANITDDELATLHEKYPKEKISLTRTERFDPCVTCGCVALACGGMSTYRDTYGCVGRSWEHPFIQAFYPPDCNEVYEVLREKGAEEAGRFMINKSIDGPKCTQKQYEEIVRKMEKEWAEIDAKLNSDNN